MRIRWKSVLTLLAFTLPAALAGSLLSVAIKHRMQEVVENNRVYTVASRMRLAVIAAEQYAGEHKGHWPDAYCWEQELQPYTPPGYDFTLPAPPSTKPRRIAINPRCAGKIRGDGTVILFFESVSPERNAHDDLHSLPKNSDGSTLYHLQFCGGQAYDYPLEYCDFMRSDPNWARRNLGSL